jgi:hypothetical protein
MKIFTFGLRTSRMLLGGLAALGASIAQGGTIQYTYDRAGRLLLADYGNDRTASYAYDRAGNLLAAGAPTPGLAFGPGAGGGLTLSWPATPAGFGLQSAPALDGGLSWNALSVTPTQVDNLLSVTIPLNQGASQFYRLAK